VQEADADGDEYMTKSEFVNMMRSAQQKESSHKEAEKKALFKLEQFYDEEDKEWDEFNPSGGETSDSVAADATVSASQVIGATATGQGRETPNLMVVPTKMQVAVVDKDDMELQEAHEFFRGYGTVSTTTRPKEEQSWDNPDDSFWDESTSDVSNSVARKTTDLVSNPIATAARSNITNSTDAGSQQCAATDVNAPSAVGYDTQLFGKFPAFGEVSK